MTTSLQKRLDQAVAELPSTASEIARLFKDNAITGRRHIPHACPVAQYIARQVHLLPTATAVVGVTQVSISAITSDVWDTVARADLPNQVRDFIEDFDLGAYPDLEDQS